MPSFLGKIRDYERLEKLVREYEEQLESLRKENESLRQELARRRGQLEHSLERVKEERKRRAEEEEKRGSLKKQLEEVTKEVERLKAMMKEREVQATEPARQAILLEEVELSPEAVREFVERHDFASGEHLSLALPRQDRSRIFSLMPILSEWEHRIDRNDPSIVLFAAGRRVIILAPPVPITELQQKKGPSFDLDILSPLMPRQKSCFISLHRDMYVVCSVNDTVGDVTYERKETLGKTKKGGFSQARFSRFREDQFKHLVSEALESVRQLVMSKSPNLLFVEGDDRSTAALIRELSSVLPEVPLKRVSLRSKPTRSDLPNLPELLWKWRAWVFDVEGTQDQPSG